MRSAAWGRSSGCPRRCGLASATPAARAGHSNQRGVTEERLHRFSRQADAIARAELTAAGFDRGGLAVCARLSCWLTCGQWASRVTAAVMGTRSLSDRVSSEDAMTADWPRLPYDVMERISTRITHEVRETNRVVSDVAAARALGGASRRSTNGSATPPDVGSATGRGSVPLG